MKRVSTMQTMLALTALMIGTAAIASADHGGPGKGNNNQTRLKTRLAGAAIQGKTPEGNAEFRSESAKGRTEFKVELEGVNLAQGTVLDVAVQHGGASQVVGQITLSALGEGEVELQSQDGDTVPAVQKGDMVVVSNAGTAILSGVF